MWQIYSLGSTFFSALDESVDKANIVRQKAVGLFTATWIRNAAYCLIALFAAFVIGGQKPEFVFTGLILLLGLTNAVNSVFYTVLLRRLEITTSGILFNVTPLIFLVTDIFFLGRKLSLEEVAGIFLLVLGGILFLGRKKIFGKFGKEKRLAVFGIFAFNVLYIGFQSYLFQYYSAHFAVSETNFLISMSIATLLFLSIAFVFAELRSKRMHANIPLLARYSYGSLISKTADYGSSFFFLKALTMASLSQASAMQSFFPIMLMFLVILMQGSLHIDMKEDLKKRALMHKISGIILISAGIFLVR